MRGSILNIRKLHCRVVEVSTCHFCAVLAQAWPKIRVGPYSSPCQDPRHGTALVFVSCWHGPKYFMSCRASGHAKRPCHDPPSNSTAQVLALSSSIACRPHLIFHLIWSINVVINYQKPKWDFRWPRRVSGGLVEVAMSSSDKWRKQQLGNTLWWLVSAEWL
jgi:hypothetical protein